MKYLKNVKIKKCNSFFYKIFTSIILKWKNIDQSINKVFIYKYCKKSLFFQF